MTNNINPKNKKSNLFPDSATKNKKQRRSKHYQCVRKVKSTQELHDYLLEVMLLGKGTAYHVISFFISLAVNNDKKIFVSTEYLAKKIGVHPKTISRVTGVLEAMGLIHKHWRGFKKSREYCLAPAFYDPMVQYGIYMLFPSMRARAAQLFHDTGKFIEAFIDGVRSLFSPGVTHNKQCKNFNINNYNERDSYRPKREYSEQSSSQEFQSIGSLLSNLLNFGKTPSPTPAGFPQHVDFTYPENINPTPVVRSSRIPDQDNSFLQEFPYPFESKN